MIVRVDDITTHFKWNDTLWFHCILLSHSLCVCTVCIADDVKASWAVKWVEKQTVVRRLKIDWTSFTPKEWSVSGELHWNNIPTVVKNMETPCLEQTLRLLLAVNTEAAPNTQNTTFPVGQM